MEVSINRSAFTFDDFHNPQLITLNTIYWDTTLGITTVFFVFMMYAIVKKSTKEMGSYKWYLCHQLLWSYAFDVHVSLWKPIPLWPFYACYSSGVYGSFHGKVAYVPFIVLYMISIGMGVSIFMSMIHRFMQAAPFSKMYEIYNILWLRYFAFVFIFVSIEIGFLTAILLFIPDVEELRKSLEKQNPVFVMLFRDHPSMFGFDPASNGNLSVAFMLVLLIVFGLLALLVIVVYFIFIALINKNRIFMSEQTYKLQLILFKALTLQVAFVLILLIFPVFICVIATFFDWRGVPQFCLCVIMVSATHTVLDFAAIVYYVKAYRVFFADLRRYCLRKVGIYLAEPVGPTSAPPSISATSQNPRTQGHLARQRDRQIIIG